ncbi:MAG: sigma-70 family RNA polymerase sigma factor [Verrucomicrobiota bacterium]
MDGQINETTKHVTRLWTLAQPRVAAFVTSVVRDFRDRDDLMQDIAVAVFESFDAYDPERPFVQWAMGVARNQFKTYLRHRKRHFAVFDPETVEVLEKTFGELQPEDVRDLDFLQNCLKKLDGKSRRLCELRYFEDLKPAAISQAMGIPGTAVRKALQRIREQLRLCVQRQTAAEGVVG